MTILTGGLLGPYLITGGLASGAPATPLLIQAPLQVERIVPPAPASWLTIDPERTERIPPNYGP